MKVDRAYKHILDLNAELFRFWREPGPYEILSKDNPQSGERTYYIRIIKYIPSEIPPIIGDIIQNLRSSLDHLAWHLVKSSPVTSKAKDVDIYFPIFETATEYRSGKMRKIEGMTDAAIKAIDAIEPYYRPDILPGIGKGVPLFWIDKLNKLDKHRLLIPIWEDMTSHTMPESTRIAMQSVIRAANITNPMIFSNRRTGKPLEDGSELLTLPIAEVYDDMKFRFQIAFGEPEWVRGKEILSTLVNMHRIVKGIIESFDDQGLL